MKKLFIFDSLSSIRRFVQELDLKNESINNPSAYVQRAVSNIKALPSESELLRKLRDLVRRPVTRMAEMLVQVRI